MTMMETAPGLHCPAAYRESRRFVVAISAGLSGLALVLAACSAERRPSGPDQPQTPPTGPADPRIATIESNKYQLSQGGRYFVWYGCGACHGKDARGAANLADNAWIHGGAFDQVYVSIAAGHQGPGQNYGDTVPGQQLWQITAYVRSLKDLPPAKRHRQDVDQTGEAQGSNWAGPVR